MSETHTINLSADTSSKILSKPNWLRVKAPTNSNVFSETMDIVNKHGLNTVCQEAACPNIAECWSKKHATFMILGKICTRGCKFCNIATGKPTTVDPEEPQKVALAIGDLQLKHVVITSVNRDDLPDGGAEHFAKTILAIREHNATATIEVLTPDFLHKKEAFRVVVAAAPDVYNHNLETVPRLYSQIRPGARYFNSLNLLYRVKQLNPNIVTKSGIMLGLGETDAEILEVFKDLKAAEVDIITLGQYLQPTPAHAAVDRYVSPAEFEHYQKLGQIQGFVVYAGPLVRSSYFAHEHLEAIKNQRGGLKSPQAF